MKIDNKDIKEIYSQNIRSVYKYFFFKTLNRDIAEDLTSETFLIFARQIKNATIESYELYIKGIARNVFSSYLRSKYNSKEISFTHEELDNQENTTNISKHSVNYTELLKQVLRFFPLSQRKIMQMRFIDKLSIKDITKRLGKNENYVSTTQKRAFKTLKRILSVQNR